MQKYSQQLEQHVQELKVKYQELEASKIKESEDYRNQLKETKKALESQLSMSNEKLAEEVRKNEGLTIQLQDALAGNTHAQDNIESLKKNSSMRLLLRGS